MNKLKKKSKNSRKQQILFLTVLFITILSFFYKNNFTNLVQISEKRFEKMMRDSEVEKITLVTNKKIVKIRLNQEALAKEHYKKELQSRGKKKKYHYAFKVPAAVVFNKNYKLLESQLSPSQKIGYFTEEEIDYTDFFANWGFFILFVLGFWMLSRRMSSGGSAGGIFNIGKSKAILFDEQNQVNVKFEDVAGMKEAKEEVQEIVDFLKYPEKYADMGGYIPTGILLVGEPGTGKTLLAKAVAGESNVPFFYLSGSDFIEMFVGVGSSRVRDLFKRAKEKAPCIIFIDEIDSIGKSRGNTTFEGGNEERDNTLNSLLVEMDGFTPTTGIIILAATNRPETLDSALLRPGRFDRQVSIDKPNIVEREELFKIYVGKRNKVHVNVKEEILAQQTPGFTGAEIANVCNEAALIAARKNKNNIEMEDFQDAIDREIGGLEKKTKIISKKERKIVAYHEAGHAVAGWFLENANPIVKVSIIPRGIAALGYAQYLPKEQFLYQKEQLLDEMGMALGGRAAEEIIFGKISTGALSDLEKVTQIAYNMIGVYGMSEAIGNISFYNSKKNYSFTKPYSEDTAKMIDEEVKKVVSSIYNRTKKLLLEKKKELEELAQALLQKEVLFKSDVENLIGKRNFEEEESNLNSTDKRVDK